jgi:hypothetical protein
MPQGRGQLGPQDSQRNLAVVLQILGEIDGSHATCAELALDGVAVGEGGGEAGGVDRILFPHLRLELAQESSHQLPRNVAP